MKKASYFLRITSILMLICFTFSSCDKLKDSIAPIDLFMQAKDITITIPTRSVGQHVDIATVDFDVAAEINRLNTSGISLGPNNIQSAKVNKVSAEIVGGASANNNFANFEDAGIQFASNAGGNPQFVAKVSNIPNVYSTYLDIALSGDVDVKDYLKSTQFQYLYVYNLRKATTTPLQIKIRIEYKVVLKP